MNIPTFDELVAILAADPEAGMPVDWSAQTYDPEMTYWHILDNGTRQLGTYASERDARLYVAEQIYARGQALEERYRDEPGGTRAQLHRDYERNGPAFAEEFEICPCPACDHSRPQE